MDRLDRRDVTDTAFDIVLRGYDKRQVEERLRLLGAELAAAQDALRTATQRITMLEDALNQARSGPGGEPAGDVHFGARVEKILKLAEDEAREVRAQAEAAAVAVVDQARAEAQRLVAAATDTATQRERSSAHELHQLFRLQEEINADLFRVKDVLDSLFGPGGAVAGAILHQRRKDGAQLTR
jgi:cell division septum initiation protein DivIVA